VELDKLRSPCERHYIRKVTHKSMAKEKNTVIEPWVNVMEDVIAIRAGQAQRKNNEFTINSRIYGVENTIADYNTLYPIQGAGFHQLNRAAYKALGIYNKFGNTNRANEILDHFLDDQKQPISFDDRQAALLAWQAGLEVK